jgi:hypothetical protein
MFDEFSGGVSLSLNTLFSRIMQYCDFLQHFFIRYIFVQLFAFINLGLYPDSDAACLDLDSMHLDLKH